MREDSIFYTPKWEERTDDEGKELEPLLSFQFNAVNLELANIKELKQVKGDTFSMTVEEKGKPKTVESHVLAIVSYVDDLQLQMETTMKMMKAIEDNKPKKGTKKDKK